VAFKKPANMKPIHKRKKEKASKKKKKSKRKRKGIWVTNRYGKDIVKEKRRPDGTIIPLKKKCSCGRRVFYHHYKCSKCWNEEQNRKIYKCSKLNKTMETEEEPVTEEAKIKKEVMLEMAKRGLELSQRDVSDAVDMTISRIREADLDLSYNGTNN